MSRLLDVTNLAVSFPVEGPPLKAVRKLHAKRERARHGRFVAEGVVVRPGPRALLHAQDKAAMRRRLTQAGLPCPRSRPEE